MPLQETSGTASYDAFGGGVPVAINYIEDVFSTYLYTGNYSTQTITNNIDLAGKGGLVWIKTRNQTYSHYLADTARGANNYLSSNVTSAQNWAGAQTDALTSFNSNGFSLGADGNLGWVNAGGSNMASWTFRKQPKFFDVVTYTGTSSVQNIAHNLGSVPGCIIVKSLTDTLNWNVYHRSVGNADRLILNDTIGSVSAATTWNNTDPTATQFTVGTSSQINYSGSTYVAYIFAHNAGGFGLTGTDNVISCGSFTPNGNSPFDVNLGFEPQWVMIKSTFDSSRYQGDWNIYDNMRGMPLSSGSRMLWANSSDAEYTGAATGIYPTATGFTAVGGWQTLSGGPFIYIAIRRGPMKVPTDATKVYKGITRTGTGANATVTGVGFPPSLVISSDRNSSGQKSAFYDRLRGIGTQGGGAALLSASTTTEQNYTDAVYAFGQDGLSLGPETSSASINYGGEPFVNWFFQRAPSFFDEVCYTGTGVSGATQKHSLGVTPELMIVKGRSASGRWYVYNANSGPTKYMELDTTIAASVYSAIWNDTSPTSTEFSLGNYVQVNASAATYVAYLFATCAGVSKVGSYTGNGTTQTINCGFTGGARFVLIKRTDSTGNWTTFDSARGIVAGNDPALYLNSTAAEVTTADAVDTDSTGFVVNQESTLNLNVSSATYIFLSVA